MLKNIKKTNFLAIFLFIILFFWFLYNFLVSKTFPNTLNQLGTIYFIVFYGPKAFPIIVFGLYLLLKDNQHKQMIDWFCHGFLFITIIFLVSAVTNFVFNFSTVGFQFLIANSYRWSYIGLISWLTVFCLSYFLCSRKTSEGLYCLSFSVILVSVGSMFYELPVHYRFDYGYYVDTAYPFILATEFVSIIFLAVLIKMKRWHPTKLFFVSLMIYLVHGVFWFYNPSFGLSGGNIDWVWGWIPRFVGAAVLLSLVSGIKKDFFKALLDL